MATVVSATEIPPGGEGKIEVKVSTNGKRGRLEKDVTVFSDDAENPQFRLKVQGTVDVIVALDPGRVAFGQVAKGSTQKRTVALVGKLAESVVLSDLQSPDSPHVVAEVTKENGKQVVVVTLNAPEQSRRFNTRITAKTNLDSPAELSFFVNAEVADDLVIDRNFVYFRHPTEWQSKGLLERAYAQLADATLREDPIMQVRVSSQGKQAFAITGIDDPSGAVIGSARRDGEAWVVQLMLVDPSKAERGSVKLTTDRKDQPALEVRYQSRAFPPGKPGAPASLQRADITLPKAMQKPGGMQGQQKMGPAFHPTLKPMPQKQLQMPGKGQQAPVARPAVRPVPAANTPKATP